jgi:hypothetical protein
MTTSNHTMNLAIKRSQSLKVFLASAVLFTAGMTITSSVSAQSLCCDKTAQGGCLVPMPARANPSSTKDVGRYADAHKRLDKLDTGNCANAYHLNKAQAWLNLSRDFHYEGDGSNASNAAYEEAEKIIKALEEGKAPSLDTAMIQNATKLRADLWDIAAARKATPALLSSAAREVAYCEVYLVRAGHADANLGGKARVTPLIGMAQDVCAAAKEKPTCPVPVAAPAPPPPPPAAVPAPAPAPAAPAVVVTPPPAPVVTPAPVPAPVKVAPKRRAKQDRN